MRHRLTRFVVCGCLVAASGCQNPLSHTANFGERDSLKARLAFSSDDPSPLEVGRGHLPSLASEMADRRHDSEDRSPGIPGGSSLTIKRLLERANDADAHGRAQEARMYYEQVLAEQPNHAEAHHRLAILADQSGDYAAAERHYQMALRENPTDADVLNDLGYSYFLQGRAVECERYLKQALQIEPRHPHVQENLSLLYDQTKAEKVLMSIMGPRQTQATLARLFHNVPADGITPPQTAHRGPEQNPLPPSRGATASTAEVLPDHLQELQRKMEEARLKSIADRRQRNAPQYQPGPDPRFANVPQLPADYPRQSPPPSLTQGREVPDGQINLAFQNIDAGGYSQQPRGNAGLLANRSSQVPADFGNAAMRNLHPMPPANLDQTAMPEPRAAAPQWNTLPQWPQTPSQTSPSEAIQQTHHTQPGLLPPLGNGARPITPSAAERAAEIGMAAGPGAIFPNWNAETNPSAALSGPVPAARSLPGTNSRMNGTMYPQPGGAGVPSDWDSAASAGQSPANWNPPAPQLDRSQAPANYSSAPTSGFQSGPPIDPRMDQYGTDRYDHMRSAQNTQFNQDQQQLAANPELMTSGPQGREAVPGTFDPSRQDWPAYTREQYDTRNMNQPAAEPQRPFNDPGQFQGQIVPQYNPSMQSPPQNYGRRW